MNQYEQAFGSWLSEQRLQFVSIDQQKRAVFVRNSIKSFDYLVYPSGPNFFEGPGSPRNCCNISPIIVEVKGRLFKGNTLAGLKNIQCWTTMEDIRGLTAWEDAFEESMPYRAFFVFAFRLENPFVETGLHETYEYGGERFCFLAVSLDNYKQNMTVRSRSWQTVTLSADNFRSFNIPAKQLFCGKITNEDNYHTDGRVCS